MAEPKFFSSATEFRKWLERYHQSKSELLVGFYKVNTGRPSMTWSESVDQALCFGWIDGVRKRIDDDSYSIRFTPRKSGSTWSAINIAKIEELRDRGLLHPAGIAAFEKRSDKKSVIYSYEKPPVELDPELEKIFRNNSQAWAFFNKQPPGYKKTAIHFVMGGKHENTRTSRLERLILASESGRRL